MKTIKINGKKKTGLEHDLELEIFTKKFISGELGLNEYRKKVEDIQLDARLDLRRVASRLKPILVPIKSSD